MGTKGYVPRLSVEIREDQLADLQELLEHGERKKLFGLIVDDVIRLLRKDKAGFLMVVYAKALKIEDYSIRIGDINHGNSKRPSHVHTRDVRFRETGAHPGSTAGSKISAEESPENQYLQGQITEEEYLDES